MYTQELFNVVEDSLKLRREIQLLENIKDKIELDLDSSDEHISQSNKNLEAEDFKIIELKVSLDENDFEYQTIFAKIQQISRVISGNRCKEQEETASPQLSNYEKAKHMLRRLKEQRLDNVVLQESILEQKAERESNKQNSDPNSAPDVLEAMSMKKQLEGLLNSKNAELVEIQNSVASKSAEIDLHKQKALANVHTIIKSWREDRNK